MAGALHLATHVQRPAAHRPTSTRVRVCVLRLRRVAQVWRYLLDREIEAPDRFRAIQTHRASMAVLRSQLVSAPPLLRRLTPPVPPRLGEGARLPRAPTHCVPS